MSRRQHHPDPAVRNELLDPFNPGDYDLAIDRVFHKVRGCLPALLREIDDSAVLFAELLREAAPRVRWERVLEEERFHSLKLCQFLTDHCREVWFTAPADALDFAGLAVGIARSLDASRYGRSLVEDARARAWAYLGNVYRILAEYARAEGAFGQAWRHLELSGDLLVRGEILRFLGSLQSSRERFADAIHLLDEAAEIYRELGDRNVETRILLNKGKTLGDAGHFDEAIKILRQALSGINSEEEPRLWVMGRHNLLLTMSDLGKHEAALKILKRSEWAYREIGGSVFWRGRWGEAILLSRLGRLEAAERILIEVSSAFAALGTMAEAAEVSFELALIHARQGRRVDSRRILAEVIPLFDSLGLRKDAFAARLLYERAGRG